MDLTPYVKKLVVPAGVVPPRQLRYDDVVASAITREDVAEDVRGINASLELIRETRGGSWPTEAVTEDEIIVDEYWHERVPRPQVLQLHPPRRRPRLHRLRLPLSDGRATVPHA